MTVGCEGDRRCAEPLTEPWTDRKARLNASVDPYPYRTATLSRSSPSMMSPAATVILRLRTYSESGMPASDENIRRR